MDETALFDEICRLLTEAGIEIRTERFHLPPDSAGGLCRLAGKHLVLLHTGASKAERSRALLEVVEQVGLDRLGIVGAELSPALLARLNRRGQMPWPHRSQAPPVAKPNPAPRGRNHLKLLMKATPLSQLTTIGLGGSPTQLEKIQHEGELVELLEQSNSENLPVYVLGGGSNVIVADEGLSGTVAKMEMRGIHIKKRRGEIWVTAGAGEVWSDFVTAMVAEGYAGLECLGGIPGSVGATPIQNVGAYGQEVGQVIKEVRVLNRKTLKMRALKNEECRFAYRSSVFKSAAQDDYIVVSVTFALRPGGSPTLNYAELRKVLGEGADLSSTLSTVVQLRRDKSMVYDPADENHRSCGSFFVNAQVEDAQLARIESATQLDVPRFPGEAGTTKIPSAWLIENAGFPRGYVHKNVGLSTKHTLCVVAHEGASTSQIIEFASLIRVTVEEKFGIRLVPEPSFWGFAELDDRLPRPH